MAMTIKDRITREVATADMTTEEQNSRNQDERTEARQNLRDTLTELNAKVERAERDLRPDRLLESHPVAASLMAGAVGFLLGATVKNRRTGPMMIAAVVSFALSMRSSRKAGASNGRDTAATG
jgi:ElaB/YqjD/DUF883 family membrane-anchored ribosome-binding protein